MVAVTLRPQLGLLRGEAAHAPPLPLGSRISACALGRHAAGRPARRLARAPEGVEAVGALDRSAGILRDPQARCFGAIERQEHRRAQRHEFGIGGDRVRAA